MTQKEVRSLKTPVGWVRVEAFSGELTGVTFVSSPVPPVENDSDLLKEAVQQLQGYLAGSLQNFSLPLSWGDIAGFRRDVLQVVAGIPFGKLITYGEIAKIVGKPGAAQAVGAAVGSNPWLIVVPCHRVIGSDRKLHGYSAAGGLVTKTWLLEHEKHEIIGGKVSLKES
jgi:methylated-DNA-[protein]-cysteine S-methyltransferase